MKSLFILAAAAAAIGAAPAVAQPSTAEDAYSVSIAYDDLNLSSPSGLRSLDRRIERAGREVCGTRDRAFLIQMDEIRACQDKFVAAAKEQIQLASRKNVTTLTAASK